jgi:hypothetical protein
MGSSDGFVWLFPYNGIILESELLFLQRVIIIIIITTTTIIIIIIIIFIVWGRNNVQILYAKLNTCTYQTTQFRIL